MALSTTFKKRMDKDIIKLIENGYDVSLFNDLNEFKVKFHGPKDTPYEGGTWKVHVFLPINYPFQSPAIGFMNKIFHPNIDEASGTVCLDVINQAWTPLYDLLNIFDIFLPQLLTYPNSNDPLNKEAAALCLQKPEVFRQKVIEYVKKFATNLSENGSVEVVELKNENLSQSEPQTINVSDVTNSDSSVSDLSIMDEEN